MSGESDEIEPIRVVSVDDLEVVSQPGMGSGDGKTSIPSIDLIFPSRASNFSGSDSVASQHFTVNPTLLKAMGGFAHYVSGQIAVLRTLSTIAVASLEDTNDSGGRNDASSSSAVPTVDVPGYRQGKLYLYYGKRKIGTVESDPAKVYQLIKEKQ